MSPNSRLQQASNGPPSIRKRPPDDDKDAVQRIQKALASFGFKLPKSFPNGPGLEPDGLYGPETEGAVRDFQKQAFPGQYSQWDGRCGPNTLGKMDQRLVDNPVRPIGEIECVPAGRGSSPSYCLVRGHPPVLIPPAPPVPLPSLAKARGKVGAPVRRFYLENAWPKG
ncbi:peptidoglycan-binding protein [Erythrobacter sp. JK5]|uniref:peptidoglycan-binding domain-containing protein n=1 Tax=Erythrobacter sp. JK5 TaxID=2829500 RepID=UPI001BAA9B9D|nr:peptidoglycan-binding domain-containing protein [Erythrobacter sp. JK5]QUL39139.1 peptidoglycan-binding protein [Erythrobacter sp. JK5]